MKTQARQNYAAERLDPRWQRKRLEIMQRDNFRCRACDGTENTLHVHHAYYVKGRKCWDYPAFALKTMCEECHEIEHDFASDPPDNNSDIKEWESEIDWLLLGDSKNAGQLWDLAAELSMAFRDGYSYRDVITIIRNTRIN
jgi:hypothetical protein